MTRNFVVRCLAVLAIAAAGCGSDGKTGPQGPEGPAGPPGPAAGQGSALKLVIDKVETATVDGAPKSTITFTIFPSSAVCPGGTCDANLASLGQKTFYATEYDPAARTFTTAKSFSFVDHAFVGTRTDPQLGTGAQYTAARANASFAPESSAHAMIYGYVADKEVLPREANRNYRFYDNVASAARTYGTVEYTSAANVTGCEKCHGAPYSKHGYRQAAVANLGDFASCKTCHTDQRKGGHQFWQLLVDDPVAAAASGGTTNDAQNAKYPYTATVMNDTHMSHAMEFAFPQTMANCVACHEGKLDMILADSNFKIETCKSCHPMTGPGPRGTDFRADGTDKKRAPALLGTATAEGVMPFAIHGRIDFAAMPCSNCHTAGTFKRIHSGYNKAIYADDGSRFGDAVATTVDSATFDAATNKATVTFSMTGLAANALVKPTVVVSLYGYDTKDFVISGHSSQFTDRTPNLEYTYGATVRNSNPPVPATTSRLTLDPAAPTAGATQWTAVADLSTWADVIGTGKQIKRLEIAFLPAVGRDQTAAVSATNPAIAVPGKTATVDLVGGALVADKDSYGKAIVDPAKCNKCHDALGTTFHGPNYGSAGVVGCRLCHFVGTGGSHLEMQSRSIDSYVHAIHSFQAFDVGAIDFTDPVEAMEYEHHVESVYPNFSILNCSSCHEAGTYEVPDQGKSLPSISSAASTVAGRSIGGVTAKVTGPASRACGSCHRAEAIKEDDAGALAAVNEHTTMFGTFIDAGTGTATLDAVTQNIMKTLSGVPTTLTAPAGMKIESCEVCHGNVGATHQAAFDRYADGL